MSGEWLKLLQEGRIEREKLQEQVQDIRNMFLNIKLNSNMFLKIMRLEQREIQTNLKIAALEKKVEEIFKSIHGIEPIFLKTDNVMGHPVLYTNKKTKELLKRARNLNL